ncbi:DUF5317 domain-containing protein [Sutcliffiella sp. NC1]|uniref:DUF5317 domain-containing protein n=1 Tax=Sutcliffiella sp. NC1 TaxID=3004096 RepID=UPI0022DD8288|nr:DUF5317 domain-containing protein [Sutcliffiella sp. NC1]WBL14557.1 DUF5317 domain-containing protein [Sutcliffiella sp. NC1]
MVYDGILVGIIVALLRGGNFSKFAELKFKYALIFPILLIVQITIFAIQNKFELVGNYSNITFMLIYVIGIYLLWLNREHRGFNLILVGVVLNFIVMAVNGGRMPVSIEASQMLDPYFVEALTNSLYGKHEAITEATRLAFLGDIIPLQAPYPKEQVISIGDVIMNIGVFIFIQYVMVESRKNANKVSSSTN